MKQKFRIRLTAEVENFLSQLNEKTRDKIIYNLKIAQKRNEINLFKKINKNVWEFRTLYNRTHYRLFAFWDKSENLVIATHGIIKKTSKVPKKEIEKTELIMEQYFGNK